MSPFPKQHGTRITVSPLILMCCPHFSSDVRSLWRDSGCVIHLPGATTSRQPFYCSGSSLEGLRNRVLFKINTDNQPPASGVKAAPQWSNNRNDRLCVTRLDDHGDREYDKPQQTETAFSLLYRVTPINYAHLQSQKKKP